MKALTVYQPFATLLLLTDCTGERAKIFETRPETCTWLSYRGPVAIHAGKSQDFMHLCDKEPFRSTLARHGLSKDDLVFGAVIGEVIMDYVLRTEEMGRPRFEHEAEFGNFAPGRVAIHTRSPVLYEQLVPARGQQGLWNWDGEIDGS